MFSGRRPGCVVGPDEAQGAFCPGERVASSAYSRFVWMMRLGTARICSKGITIAVRFTLRNGLPERNKVIDIKSA